MTAAEPPLPASPPQWRRLLSGVSIAVITTVLMLFARRLGYPFELEWMEGALVDHMDRVCQGLGIYVEPTPDHIALLYTPLLYHLGALLTPATGGGFLTLRLVSVLATLACAALLFRFVVRGGGDRRQGLLAAGLFAAGYGYVQSWYDLARNDTLFLALTLWTAYLLRFGGRGSAWLAGGVAVLAFLAKQTALMWLPALAVGALLFDVRRGLCYAVTAAIGIAVTVVGLDRATDGWFTFFVFDMPGSHGIQSDRKLGFWTDDLVPLLPMLVAATWLLERMVRAGEWRSALFLAAFAGGGLVTSFLSRLHLGGFDNVMMYVLAAGCVSLALLPSRLVSRRQQSLAAGLAVLQFVLLVLDVRSLWLERPGLQLDPWRFLPAPAHAEASEQMLEFVRSVDGPVLMPFHGHLVAMAGKAPSAHAVALGDLMQRLRADAAGQANELALRAAQSLTGGFETDFARRRWQAIVLDDRFGRVFEQQFAPARHGYRRSAKVPIAVPSALEPAVGLRTGAPYVLAPR